jgi:uncharacterized protein YaeQ
VAHPSTLYRFRLAISDIDRSFYESLDFRIAMHPSETEPYLITRVLAYGLNYVEGLEFSSGLSTADEPAIKLLGPNGEYLLWIDIGNPVSRRLHKAAKASKAVRVYTYKNPENIKREAQGAAIHRASEIEVFAFEPSFLGSLAASLQRDNAWNLIHNEGELIVTSQDQSFMGKLEQHRLD